MNKKNNRKGFTIVELVIVIAVIAILATVLVPTFGTVIQDAQKTALKQELKNEYTAYAIDQKTGGTVTIKLESGYYEVTDGNPGQNPEALTKAQVEALTEYWDAASNKMLHKYVDAQVNDAEADGHGLCDTCTETEADGDHIPTTPAE